MSKRSDTYYARHRDERLAYQNARYALKRASLQAYQREYRELHKKKEANRKKTWRDAHREEWNAAERRRRVSNPERERARRRRYAVLHPEKLWELAARRRARQRATTVAAVDFKAVLKLANGRCGICKQPFDLFGIEFDHIIPLSRGGTHTTNNIQATHSRCNRKKGAKLPEEMVS